MSSPHPQLSIIIPTLNEAAGLGDLLTYLHKILADYPNEIIIVDGGSEDDTALIGRKHECRIVQAARGRAGQLNAGAAVARGDLLYFLHADSYPPADFLVWLREFAGSPAQSATFRLAFYPDSLLLRQYSYFTRYRCNAFRFGDASLLVKQQAFQAIGGFDESFHLMEDNDIVRRLQAYGGFRLLPANVRTSSRKYQEHGEVKLQAVFVLLYFLQRLGMGQTRLRKVYEWALRRR